MYFDLKRAPTIYFKVPLLVLIKIVLQKYAFKTNCEAAEKKLINFG